MTYKEKINKVINLHRTKEGLNILESKKETNMVMYMLWLNWEINNLKKLKPTADRKYVLDCMYELVDVIYYKYLNLCMR